MKATAKGFPMPLPMKPHIFKVSDLFSKNLKAILIYLCVCVCERERESERERERERERGASVLYALNG